MAVSVVVFVVIGVLLNHPKNQNWLVKPKH